jgi:hypothetical protein
MATRWTIDYSRFELFQSYTSVNINASDLLSLLVSEKSEPSICMHRQICKIKENQGKKDKSIT